MPAVDPSSMRIAMLGPISWRTPPRHYGPWELFVSMLTEGLVERGVDVTLFATADSITKARLIATAVRGYSEDPDIEPKVWEGLHISQVFERSGEFDLIHNNFDYLPLTYSRLVGTPVLTTIHGFSSERILPVYEKYNGHGYYVAISDADRNEKLDYIATVHHGIVLDDFDLSAEPGDYLLFFGRIHHDKGAAEAIRVARRSGLPLVIAGIIQDQAYFDSEVAPHLDDETVRYVGPVGPQRRNELLGGALALLHLINFDEPFGLSVVEGMACGTPVVAVERGSMPELIEHGVDGFLVDGIDAAIEAVAAVPSLDRRRVRQTIEDRFTHDRMVDEYIAVYQRVLELHAKGARAR
jgi:glycosyltransferase involved in cell wall biosynthesis